MHVQKGKVVALVKGNWYVALLAHIERGKSVHRARTAGGRQSGARMQQTAASHSATGAQHHRCWPPGDDTARQGTAQRGWRQSRADSSKTLSGWNTLKE